MGELVCKAKYDNSIDLCSYLVEKETSASTVSIILFNTSKEPRKKLRRIEYKNLGGEYSSPFLSWYNLFFCSNNYDPTPDYDYMHSAVQAGRKTAATVYLPPDSDEGQQLIRELPEDCGAVPYGDNILYVFHKGCLADFFEFERIKEIYNKNGVWGIDWNYIQEMFQKPLEYFGDEQVCGFSLQSGGNESQTVLTGLLLGYPIESTIAWLSGHVEIFSSF